MLIWFLLATVCKGLWEKSGIRANSINPLFTIVCQKPLQMERAYCLKSQISPHAPCSLLLRLQNSFPRSAYEGGRWLLWSNNILNKFCQWDSLVIFLWILWLRLMPQVAVGQLFISRRGTEPFRDGISGTEYCDWERKKCVCSHSLLLSGFF